MMKRLVFGVVGLMVFHAVYGQYKGPRFPINDKWFWNYGSNGLQVGDTMPDIDFGKVLNNMTGKQHFSDLQGKLVILDYWSTGCTSCMASFPHMESLQKEFGNQIQIFIVNPWETEQEIKERMGASYLRKYRLPNLPSIVGASSYENVMEFDKNPPPLGKYFPTQGVPHHVWIDGNGIVRMRGGSENTYAQKIRDFLTGKPIEFLSNNSTIPTMANDKKARYYQQLGYLQLTPVKYGSFLTPYTNEMTGAYGAELSQVDTLSQTQIHTFINKELYELFLHCYRRSDKFLKDTLRDALLFSPTSSFLDFTEFPHGTDTLDYLSNFPFESRRFTTEEIIKSRYCYEQIIPLRTPQQKGAMWMLEDLNRYFQIQIGISANIIRKEVPCYVLVRTSSKDKIGVEKVDKYGIVVLEDNGDSLLQFSGPLDLFLRHILRDGVRHIKIPIRDDTNGNGFLVFNATGWGKGKLINLILKNPFEIHSIEELRWALQANGLDLVKEEKLLTFLIFQKGQVNN